MKIRDAHAEEVLKHESPEVIEKILHEITREWKTPLECADTLKIPLGRVARILFMLRRTEQVDVRKLSVNGDGSPCVRYKRAG